MQLISNYQKILMLRVCCLSPIPIKSNLIASSSFFSILSSIQLNYSTCQHSFVATTSRFSLFASQGNSHISPSFHHFNTNCLVQRLAFQVALCISIHLLLAIFCFCFTLINLINTFTFNKFTPSL